MKWYDPPEGPGYVIEDVQKSGISAYLSEFFVELSAMPISLAQLKGQLKQLIEESDATNASQVQGKLWEFMQYSIENYEALDEEAKSYIDRVFKGLQKAAQAVADALPDGPDKRQMVRQLSLAGGGHFLAENLISILESPSQHLSPVVTAARQAFAQLLQRTLDVLFDATRHTYKGPANFAKIGLCYWAIDELLAAVRLAQCAFTNQCYAHVRTVSEILDLLELFDKQPQWAQLWVTGDDKEVWSNLRPGAVRKKLGAPKSDPMYSFLSEHGSHGTFRGLQARSLRVDRKDGEDKKSFKVWVGGSPIMHHIVWTNSLCVYTALRLLVKCAGIFAEYLNADEIEGVLKSSGEATGRFFREHYVVWAKEAGLNYGPMVEFLDTAPWREAH
jgi:hypothetical protein